MNRKKKGETVSCPRTIESAIGSCMSTWRRKKWEKAIPMLKKKAAGKADLETLNDLLTCYGALNDLE